MIANLAPTPLFHSHRKVSVERMKPLQQGFTFLGFAGFISEEPGRGRPAAGWATAHDRVTVIGERRVLRPKRSASAASSRLAIRSWAIGSDHAPDRSDPASRDGACRQT
jgi:hypothetical protein